MENKRLTEKFNHDGFKYMATALGFNYPYAIDKLGKLEDLEEEIGCPLDVYVKATRNGYVYTTIKGIDDYVDIEIFSNDTKTFFAKKGTTIWIMCEDYGKTWWLKEDRSE